MARINYLGGLKRSYDHVKTNQEDSTYEPTMVIHHDNRPGRSFMITLSAFWKYLDPKNNLDALKADWEEFKKLQERVEFKLRFMLPGSQALHEAKNDAVDLQLASALHMATRILPCVCFNLSKCLRMFDITVNPESASQLHMWIQDGIEELKNMPEAPAEKDLVMGEVQLWEGGEKVATREMTVKESDLITEGNA